MRWLILVMAAAALGGYWWRRRAGVDRERRLMLLCRRAGLAFAPLDLSPDTAWLPFSMFVHPEHGTGTSCRIPGGERASARARGLQPPVLLLFDAAIAIRRRIPGVVASLFPARPISGPREQRWLQGRWSPEPTGAE